MPKKEWTEEEKRAFGEKMKAARAKAEQVEKPVEPRQDLNIDIAEEPTIADLLRRIEELEREKKDFSLPQQPQTQQPIVTNRGVIGTYEKYSVNPANYPSPVERLAEDPRLKRFAFNDNYELKYTVTSTNYQTQDGTNVKEPKFNLQLSRIIYDDDGEPTNGRYVVKRMVLHEDPQAAIEVASQKGITVDESRELDFLNEMRYLQIRDWLLNIFYPPKPEASKKRKEMVINGQLVEFYEASSEKSQAVPFSEMSKSYRG